jgi:integrase
LREEVHACGLRHTHANELRSEGVDLGVISKQIGTTARYSAYINPQQDEDVLACVLKW